MSSCVGSTMSFLDGFNLDTFMPQNVNVVAPTWGGALDRSNALLARFDQARKRPSVASLKPSYVLLVGADANRDRSNVVHGRGSSGRPNNSATSLERAGAIYSGHLDIAQREANNCARINRPNRRASVEWDCGQIYVEIVSCGYFLGWGWQASARSARTRGPSFFFQAASEVERLGALRRVLTHVRRSSQR